MNLKYLLETYDKYVIANHMQEVYPKESKENLIGYIDVIEQLMETEHVPNDMIVHIRYMDKDFDGSDLPKDQCYHDLYGIKPNDDNHWALDFHPWGEFLKSEMDIDTTIYDDLDIICHCLWEMTFYGWTDADMLGVVADLNRRVEDIKSGKEKDITFTSVEDMKAHFDDKIK